MRRSATATARSSSGFYFGLLYRDRIALGDPHPGNYLLCPDGRVCFLDFGLLRDVDAARVAAERAIALAVRDRRRGGPQGGAASRAATCRRAAPMPSTPTSRCA